MLKFLCHSLVNDLPSSTTDFGQCELHTPYFSLVSQTVFADSLQFGVAVREVLAS